MKVSIIKYNAGNIRSVDYALRRLGIEAEITADEKALRQSDRIIFPGVGEASSTMEYMRREGLDRLIPTFRQPVLGICRGLQTINVAFGGTLIQDMPAQMGKEYAYHDQKQPTWQPVHEVTFSDNSKVGKLFGINRIMTNSHHHQCTDRLGKGLIASGHTADGVIEALETPDGKIMAVQFHPERMIYTDRRMSEFFSRWCNSLKS